MNAGLIILLVLAPIYILVMLALLEVSAPCPKWLSPILARHIKLNREIGRHHKVINLYFVTITLDYEVSYRQEIRQ